MIERIKAYFKRWIHGLIGNTKYIFFGNFNSLVGSHRDITFWANYNGKHVTSLIACECGKIFWKHEELFKGCSDKNIRDLVLKFNKDFDKWAKEKFDERKKNSFH